MRLKNWIVPVVLVVYLPAVISMSAAILYLRGAHDDAAASEFIASLKADPTAPAFLTLISVLGWATLAVLLYSNAVGVS